jgi:hypothetical protein
VLIYQSNKILEIQRVSPGPDSFIEPKCCHSQFNSTATATTVVVAVCSSPHALHSFTLENTDSMVMDKDENAHARAVQSTEY